MPSDKPFRKTIIWYDSDLTKLVANTTAGGGQNKGSQKKTEYYTHIMSIKPPQKFPFCLFSSPQHTELTYSISDEGIICNKNTIFFK
jgi:hypothetical protein